MQVVIGTGRPKLVPRCRSETKARNWSLADQRRVSAHLFAYALSWLGVTFDVDFVYVELWECWAFGLEPVAAKLPTQYPKNPRRAPPRSEREACTVCWPMITRLLFNSRDVFVNLHLITSRVAPGGTRLTSPGTSGMLCILVVFCHREVPWQTSDSTRTIECFR